MYEKDYFDDEKEREYRKRIQEIIKSSNSECDFISEVELMEIVSDNLQSIMKEQGYTQEELAKDAYLSKATISNIINKRSLLSMRAFINIVYVTGCEPEDLVPLHYLVEQRLL